jgi:23S rRNA pseudouridine1911/1915/1917 synthase
MKTAQFTVPPREQGIALRDFIAARLGLSRGKAKGLLDARNVFVNARRVWMARHALAGGDRVEVVMPPPASDARPALRILYRDAVYIVVDKPPRYLSNGADSVEDLLREQLGNPEILAVHRLDRDTSGCLLLAIGRAAFEAAVPLFREGGVKKIYHAMAAGRVELPVQTIQTPIDGERAVTHLRRLDAGAEATHLLVTIETGRTHQIRKHLSAAGHPILGDRQYGTRAPATARAIRVSRQMLHAHSIAFESPGGGCRVHAVAPLPADFRSCLREFGLT